MEPINITIENILAVSEYKYLTQFVVPAIIKYEEQEFMIKYGIAEEEGDEPMEFVELTNEELDDVFMEDPEPLSFQEFIELDADELIKLFTEN
jgi:hypothetical protein